MNLQIDIMDKGTNAKKMHRINYIYYGIWLQIFVKVLKIKLMVNTQEKQHLK